MDQEFREGRLYLRRNPEERQPIVARLARIEGQVRGIRQMIEEDRYCGDELQQASAVMAAMREVAVLITLQHCEAGIHHALSNSDRDATTEDMMKVLRSALKL